MQADIDSSTSQVLTIQKVLAELSCLHHTSDNSPLHQPTFECRCLKMPHVADEADAMKASSLDDLGLTTITKYNA